MKKIAAALLCLLFLLSACHAEPQEVPDAEELLGYSELQSAELAFGQSDLQLSYRGNRVLDGTVVNWYAVSQNGQTIGAVAQDTEGRWYADTDNNGLFTTLKIQQGRAVFGEEIRFGETAAQYLKWEGDLSALPVGAQDNFTAVFDAVYADMHRMYGQGDLKQITVCVADCENGAAYTDGVIYISPDYLREHTNDYDILTEMLMYAVTGLDGRGSDMQWLIDGLAGYGRIRFGVYREYNRYSITYDPAAPLTESAAHTTVFLDWVSDQFDWDFTAYLCRALQNGTYDTEDVWVDRIGFTLDELWNIYQTMVVGAADTADQTSDSWRENRA